MKTYHKIQTVFKRDPATKFRTLLAGEYSLPEFEYLRDTRWVFTEKVDGTNIRILWDGEAASIAGKTDKAQLPKELSDVLLCVFQAPHMCNILVDKFGPEGGVCLYGEGYGSKIQKGGGLYRSNQSFVLFDVKIGDWWLQREDVENIGEILGLEVVPIIGEGTLEDMAELAYKGFDSQWGPFRAEGIVARPRVELSDRAGRRVITKIKCRDFNK